MKRFNDVVEDKCGCHHPIGHSEQNIHLQHSSQAISSDAIAICTKIDYWLLTLNRTDH